MKISIIGFSGSGKTSFSKKLASFYDIPLLHLDDIHFDVDWNVLDLYENRIKVNDFLNNENWIVEGNYFDLANDARFEDADVVFIFKHNRFYCFFKAFYRHIKSYFNLDVFHGKNRPKFNLDFIYWILIKGRKHKYTIYYDEIQNKYPDKVIIFKKNKQLNKYLEYLLYNKDSK